jgi:hypothetical protein
MPFIPTLAYLTEGASKTIPKSVAKDFEAGLGAQTQSQGRWVEMGRNLERSIPLRKVHRSPFPAVRTYRFMIPLCTAPYI